MEARTACACSMTGCTCLTRRPRITEPWPCWALKLRVQVRISHDDRSTC